MFKRGKKGQKTLGGGQRGLETGKRKKGESGWKSLPKKNLFLPVRTNTPYSLVQGGGRKKENYVKGSAGVNRV